MAAGTYDKYDNVQGLPSVSPDGGHHITGGGVYEATKSNTGGPIIVDAADEVVVILNDVELSGATSQLQILGTSNVTLYLVENTTNNLLALARIPA